MDTLLELLRAPSFDARLGGFLEALRAQHDARAVTLVEVCLRDRRLAPRVRASALGATPGVEVPVETFAAMVEAGYVRGVIDAAHAVGAPTRSRSRPAGGPAPTRRSASPTAR
jgi:hypothetical protein